MGAYEDIMGGGAGNQQQQNYQVANPLPKKVLTQANVTPAATTPVATPAPVAAATPAATDYMAQIKALYQNLYANQGQMTTAAQSILPSLQARLGGFDSATGQAMRLQGNRAIQSQYGTALRAATSRAGAQGVRGPAAIAMQQDIRNQMGQATANFNTDLTAKNWDAQTQALQNYYQGLQNERGGVLGTLGGLQQQVNTETGFNQYDAALKAQLANTQKTNGGIFGDGSIGGIMQSPLFNPFQIPQYFSNGVNLGR
jgi:hypothetical protein